MNKIELLAHALQTFSGMDQEAFDLSVPFWQERSYDKGEFYNEYKNVCRHLGFVIDGVFRTYYIHSDTGEEKNAFFFSKNQIIVSYKSFINQAPCNYYTASLTNSTILYIGYDQLMQLYTQSHQWERFGRFVAESAFNTSMGRAEDFMFRTPEQRYQDMVEMHPDIFNNVPLYHIASYLGIQGPSLSRIRKRMAQR
ncbi:Crp/Fnr family transcriptional regulator [Cytophagaceae bacterium DM2B3-1]|uniref:Crp/Fnr family transcriptional regulator n=1 Tax=Xanthocytophaga flava TaxID=3048013 RepID=A0ABT7CQ85_9BACT|nr:Crp/Fnr family transcriptional regulator [Xanthocytophaga flavus]MDJ1495918.1 Crp/Fnr family transcriptional regulator [Xanthocytophaga flavus]